MDGWIREAKLRVIELNWIESERMMYRERSRKGEIVNLQKERVKGHRQLIDRQRRQTTSLPLLRDTCLEV